MTIDVDVQIASACDAIPSNGDLQQWVRKAMEIAGHHNGEVSLRVVDSEEMQALNFQFRKKNAPTNVLSFATATIAGLPASSVPPLGDIVVCADVVTAEAKEQQKEAPDHWAHMLVHGSLHLLGFDHENDREAAAMEQLEVTILADLDVANPYKESGH